MNRVLALFLAMAILLAHTLAIHVDSAGDFAHPHDMAHVAFRMARNFVHRGTFAWDPGLHPAESYPSILWVAVATVAERFYLPVTTFCQTIGIASALLTILVAARFSPGRLSGAIAPMLLVVSGGVAAAAASGTETPLFALLITVAFLAYERREAWALGVALGLCCLTRPEGTLLTAFLLAIELVRVVRRSEEVRQKPLLRAFALPLAVTVVIVAARIALTGHADSPTLEALLSPTGERLRRGLDYQIDFLVGSVGPLLLFLPIWYLLRGVLSGTGIRALLLSLFWFGIVFLSGGGTLPMGMALVPILPVLFVSVQEAMTLALDSHRTWMPPVVWTLLILGLVGSSMASKYPGDLGPLPTEGLHRAWMEPRAKPRFGFHQKLGRMGLAEEIDLTGRLRSVGIFMRDHLDPSHTVLTPWPGAIGYLSRRRVIDVLGRTSPQPGRQRLLPWSGSPRADVAAALSTEPDYIVPQIHFAIEPPRDQDIAKEWISQLDLEPDLPRRKLALRNDLLSYEMVAVPIADRPNRPGGEWTRPFFLMRKKSLGLAPSLAVSRDGRDFRVFVRHSSHDQLADLRILVVDEQGRHWTMSPTGNLVKGSGVMARTHLLLYSTGTRMVELFSGVLPEQPQAVELRVVLRNPGAKGEHAFALASEELVLRR